MCLPGGSLAPERPLSCVLGDLQLSVFHTLTRQRARIRRETIETLDAKDGADGIAAAYRDETQGIKFIVPFLLLDLGGAFVSAHFAEEAPQSPVVSDGQRHLKVDHAVCGFTAGADPDLVGVVGVGGVFVDLPADGRGNRGVERFSVKRCRQIR